MNNIQKYPTYKDSGVEWLGEIPEHWEVNRIKFLFKIGRGRVISQQELIENGKYPVYSSQTLDNGILGYIDTFDFDCTQITWTTDGAHAGTVFLRDGKHNCTNVCGTLQPVNDEQIIEFVKYALQVAAQFYKRPDTNGAKIMNGEMGEIFITIPSIAEQTAIANFLDKKTALIDKAIALKEKQIELLKERQQILIHRAVTRGLNTDVKLKDSGVEWIREIPEHWEVIKLKMVSKKITDGEHISPNFTSSGMPFLSAKDVREGFLEFPDNKFVSERDGKKFRLRCNPEIGDILLVSRGATIGRVSKVDTIEEFCLLGSVILIKPNLKIESNYLQRSMENKLLQDNLLNTSYFSAQQALYLVNVSEVKIAVPPLKEQIMIVDYLENITKKISNAISLKGKEIEKLKEYKSVLINEAVSGKIKVN